MACIEYAWDATTAVSRLNREVVFEGSVAASIASRCSATFDRFIASTLIPKGRQSLNPARADRAHFAYRDSGRIDVIIGAAIHPLERDTWSALPEMSGNTVLLCSLFAVFMLLTRVLFLVLNPVMLLMR